MQIALQILFVVVFTGLGMLGGQMMKWTRRWLAPIIATLADIAHKKERGRERFKYLVYAFLVGVLSMGYGHSSSISKFLPKDWQRRLFIGGLMGLPFVFFGMWHAVPVLMAAYSVRAGGFKIGSKDFLYEDLIRYSTLGFYVSRLIWG